MSLPANTQIALLTAGRDKHYALGLASALLQEQVMLDFIASDEVDSEALRDDPRVRYLKLRDQRADASPIQKVVRILVYYVRLLRYAASAEPQIFHILWNNKCELIDRTLLMLYYKWLGKRIVFTAHNVNAGDRDRNDNVVNRLSLRIQYALADGILVHTDKMKLQLESDFNINASKVSVIPYGINNMVPETGLSRVEARRQLGIPATAKALLFFGNIAPYKGLDYLVEAFRGLSKSDENYWLLIAGRPKGPEKYWTEIEAVIAESGVENRIIQNIDYVPDAEAEVYFKAADALILPYIHIFQSGVLFLGYNFGLPVIATDVGSLSEEIIEGETGFLCKSQDSSDLARAIRDYFGSGLYATLAQRRAEIRAYANERYSWAKVARITKEVYARLLAS